MTDLKNMMSDSELDMVVGGKATAFVSSANKDGSYTVITCRAEGDVKKMKDFLAGGGSVNNINFSGGFSQLTVSGEKLDSYIERLESRNIDIVRT